MAYFRDQDSVSLKESETKTYLHSLAVIMDQKTKVEKAAIASDWSWLDNEKTSSEEQK